MTQNTLPRLTEAIENLEHYQKKAKSGLINEILYDIRIVKAELAGEDRPEEEKAEQFKSWLGWGMNNNGEITVKL